MVAYTCNTSTGETGKGGLLRIWGQPGLHSEFKTSLGYIEKHCPPLPSKNKNKNKPFRVAWPESQQLGERGRRISEFKPSLIYRESSRTFRATQRNPACHLRTYLKQPVSPQTELPCSQPPLHLNPPIPGPAWNTCSLHRFSPHPNSIWSFNPSPTQSNIQYPLI